MAVTRQDVDHVARLARLALSEDESAEMTTQLNRILAHVEMLQEVDTTDVEPLTHPFETRNVFRADEPRPSLTQADALANAPASAEQHFLVPDSGSAG
jgi:aspartyl-tRNA(Asn)/glutamyl-tRNA(Gln) amidotransferase subunit C